MSPCSNWIRMSLTPLLLVWGVVVAAWDDDPSKTTRAPDNLKRTSAEGAGADHAAADFFESNVRPLLLDQCVKCHGPNKQSGGLRLDSRAAAIAGGDQGPALTPNHPEQSLLLKAIRRTGDLQMPPKGPLKPSDVKAIEAWIADGAVWPEGALGAEGAEESQSIAERAKRHWAFQPLSNPTPPMVKDPRWSRNPIDRFVAAQHHANGLVASPPASPATLLRRVTYSLTGLPPSPEAVQRFVASASDDPVKQASQFDAVVSELLDSPQYGEHWARRWLDVARYADTKGYVYAREERFWVHAWAYRDWVVKAFQEDLPYDRFLLLQLAADQAPDARDGDLAAMGFLTLGRRFLGVPHNIIDDRIDVVTRGTMALTVACARCHDHKYDAIPAADYYSLYGVFASCSESLVRLPNAGAAQTADEAFEAELKKRLDALENKRAAAHQESSDRVRRRVKDYLLAQTELHKYPAQGFDQVFEKDDVLPAFVRRWQDYLHRADQRKDPIFLMWHAFKDLPVDLPEDQYAAAGAELISALGKGAHQSHSLVASRFTTPPTSFQDVIGRYGELFLEIDDQWQAFVKQAVDQTAPVPKAFPDEEREQLRRVLYGPGAPCEVPDEPIVHTETFFPSADCTALWKLQGEVDRWLIRAASPPPYALSLVDRKSPVEPRVFRRGNPLLLGETTPRQFLSLLSGEDRQPFAHGSGRLELAQAIVSPKNPLTARVMVNRVWAGHFGKGLVSTPSDFGVRASPPSHPALLDYLTRQFIDRGWSLQWLHQTILSSQAYQQSSYGPQNEADLRHALNVDPANRMLWRMNARRLTFESFRDSLLAAAGDLDLAVGGKPTDLFARPYSHRRTLYGLVDRQFLPSTLRVFDFANPDLHVPQRIETTAPQQSLYFMNHPFVIERAKRLAAAAEADVNIAEERSLDKTKTNATTKATKTAPKSVQETAAAAMVRRLFLRALQREPSAEELADSLALYELAGQVEGPVTPPTAADWKYGHGEYDEAAMRTVKFGPLPHFTGSAWQGGDKWPDAKHGWAQLTAKGGHPGNTRDHGCVRRWTAPRAMQIAIHTEFVHEPAPGDGVRAFIVSSQHGLLQSAKLHQESKKLDVETRAVAPGETIDFVVDIDNVLNSDQFLWDIVIEESATSKAGGAKAVRWHAESDFPVTSVDTLTRWEQLAHVILCTNEFLFID